MGIGDIIEYEMTFPRHPRSVFVPKVLLQGFPRTDVDHNVLPRRERESGH